MLMSEKAPISASQMLNRPRLSTASDTDIPIGFWSGSSRAPTRRSRSARDLFAREAMAEIVSVSASSTNGDPVVVNAVGQKLMSQLRFRT